MSKLVPDLIFCKTDIKTKIKYNMYVCNPHTAEEDS